MGKFKELLCGMNPKVLSFMQDNPDIFQEAKDSLNSKLDALMDTEIVHEDSILNEYRNELISLISSELARQTQQSYVDCMEVAEFYTDRMKML